MHDKDSWETIKNNELSIAIDIQYGRFGNNYSTLKKILIIALYFRIKKIFLKIRTESMFKFNSKYITIVDKIDNINKKFVIAPNNGDKTIFFSNVSGFVGRDNINEQIAKKIISDQLNINKSLVLDENILVIHIRGGDIFNETRPVHHLYRQPPLVWYLACILSHKQRHSNCTVMIISEDRKNPCVNGVIRWCKSVGIRCIAKINSLEKDYTFLMNARALVVSNGTFASPCLDLNKNLTLVYRFNFNWCKEFTYIADREWKNTPEQRKLMLDMPLEHIEFPDDLYELAKSFHIFKK